jgi:hypothetical protein
MAGNAEGSPDHGRQQRQANRPDKAGQPGTLGPALTAQGKEGQ